MSITLTKRVRAAGLLSIERVGGVLLSIDSYGYTRRIRNLSKLTCDLHNKAFGATTSLDTFNAFRKSLAAFPT